MSEMIERAIQAEWEQHKQQMDAMLAQQRGMITTPITTAITEQVAAHMAAYVARIRVLEGSRHVSSEPKVTNDKASHDLGSPARVSV
ncbi:hypothetical protein FH972_015536 [Carpinus fangiana]|uniref:Uncharacterized protein n=1 Tax=Carpinus fangiana TaxID=176857 RepID=A0A5N6RGI2_9ROSI|nr:hypothetical protein FH972_015536 [Carpinus fangiana]